MVSVNTGRAETAIYRGKEAVTGIHKHRVDGAVRVSPQGVSGDEVADQVHHGGPDKAICVYSRVHFPHWEQVLGREMPFGAFGENLTVDRLYEKDVRIGDVFRVGSAVVQISQPRVPCWKLAMKWGLGELPDLVIRSGATGFYLRVLEPGEVRAGDPLELEESHAAGVTVAEANRIMHTDKHDMAGIRKLLDLKDVLAGAWIDSLESRLARLQAGG
ncbi:MOSC domain-containing protein [Cohnella sp. CFH 77786]|nr:MOSC domain-containing protein [Cohnella sp. CFH 77786]